MSTLPENPMLEAVAEILFLAAYADDEIAGEEKAQFRDAVESLTEVKLDDAAFDALLEKLTKLAEAEGRAARLASIRDRLADDRQRAVALQMAIRLTAADGIIRTAERELILEAAEALGIDGDRAADMVARLGK